MISKLKYSEHYFFAIPILLSIAAILGWLFNIPALYSYLSNGASMKFNTATATLFIAVAAITIQEGHVKISRFLSLIIFLFSLTTLAEYALTTNLYIDDWVILDELTSAHADFPGRMSVLTAVCFLLLSVALELSSVQRYHWSQGILMMCLLIVYGASIGLLLDISNLFQFGAYSAMALPTALSLMLATLGLLSASRHSGWLNEAFSKHSAAVYARYAILYFFMLLPVFVAGFIWTLKHTAATPEYLVVVMILAASALTLPLAFVILKKLNRADDDLHKLNEQLHKSTTTLANKNHELTFVNQELDSLLHIISHDLKTPLMSLEGSLALMHRNLANKIEERDRALLTIPGKSVKKLRSTIDHLSEIIKSQKLSTEGAEDIDVCELVNDLQTELADNLNSTGGRIIMEADNCVIHYKRVHLRSILQNLMTNALKFRHPDRPPVIKIQAGHENDGVRIIFSDNGLGIPAKDITTLFNKYRRFHQHIEGSGVGLYLVQQLLAIKGGTISVASEDGVGTTFMLFIPDRTNVYSLT